MTQPLPLSWRPCRHRDAGAYRAWRAYRSLAALQTALGLALGLALGAVLVTEGMRSAPSVTPSPGLSA